MKEYNNVSVYLLSPSVENIADYIKSDSCKKIDLDDVGILYYRKPDKKPVPSWVKDFFEENEKVAGIGFVASDAAAVLIVRCKVDEENPCFAVCFGTGHNLLKKNHIVKEFGLSLAKKSMNPQKISSVDLTSFESTVKNKRIQSSELTMLNDYSLNRNNDVMKSISGKTRDMGDDLQILSDRLVNGKDSINLTAKVKLSSIKTLLKSLYKQYISASTDEGVSYNSFIKTVSDIGVITKLDEILVRDLSENKGNVLIAVPEIVAGIRDNAFRIGGKDEVFDFTAAALGKIENIDVLKSLELRLIDETGNSLDTWPIYECIVSEMKIEERDKQSIYVMQSGKYYEIDSSYKRKVDNCFDNVSLEKGLKLGAWTEGEDEDTYNRAQESDTCIVMDKALVGLGGRAHIEFCDLLTSSKQLVHVKIRSNSTNISHLFNQGKISMSVLRDRDNVAIINEAIKKKGKDGFEIKNDYKPSDYSVVFVLLCKDNEIEKSGRPKIPFFSKAVFFDVFEQLDPLGIKITIMGIKMSPEKKPAIAIAVPKPPKE